MTLGPNLKARGALEDWLTAMEDNMRKVLHRCIKVALAELEGINFDGGEKHGSCLLWPAWYILMTTKILILNPLLHRVQHKRLHQHYVTMEDVLFS